MSCHSRDLVGEISDDVLTRMKAHLMFGKSTDLIIDLMLPIMSTQTRMEILRSE